MSEAKQKRERRSRGSVRQFKGKPGWYCRWRWKEGGRDRSRTILGGSTKADAEDTLTRVEARVLEGVPLLKAVEAVAATVAGTRRPVPEAPPPARTRRSTRSGRRAEGH